MRKEVGWDFSERLRSILARSLPPSLRRVPKMSSADCANCDCPDKTNCPKKQGFQLQEEVAQNPRHAILMGFVNNHRESGGVENECKCGPAVNPFYYY